MNSRTDRFLDLYKELEALVSSKYSLEEGLSAVGWMLRRSQWRDIREELAYCKDVRNLLSHNPKVAGRYAVEPSEEIVALLERVITDIRNPKQAKDLCIPRPKVLCRGLNDRVLPTLRMMDDRVYTNIPILSNGVVIGSFSENTILTLVLERGAASLDADLTFQDIRKYLPLSAHRGETYRFVREDTPLSDLEDLFAQALKDRERIGLVFVTKTGNPAEPLLGILSPWDVAAID